MNTNSAINHCQTAFSAYHSLKTPLASLLWGINRHKVPMGTWNWGVGWEIHCLFIAHGMVR